MTISLRPAEPADAATLAEINIKAFTGQGFITNTFPGVPHAVIHELKVARYLKKMAHPQTHVIVAEDDASGALVGCARWIFPAAADGNAEGNVKGAGDLVDEDSAEAARGAEDALPEGTNRGIYTGFFEILKEKGKDYLRDDDVGMFLFLFLFVSRERDSVNWQSWNSSPRSRNSNDRASARRSSAGESSGRKPRTGGSTWRPRRRDCPCTRRAGGGRWSRCTLTTRDGEARARRL